jgi:nucleoside 2-deoxyribosyltransferase
MKIFLSTSFSHMIDNNTMEVKPEFREEIEQILLTIRSVGHEVFAAVEDEGWKMSELTPAEGAKYDIRRVEEADIIIAILHEKISAGVQWEIGYADALGKKVYIMSDEATDIGYWNRALEDLGRIARLPYNRQDLKKFADTIKKI